LRERFWLVLAMVPTACLFLGMPSTAHANAILALQEDNGAIQIMASGGSLATLSYSGTFGDFTIAIFGGAATNASALSDLLSSTTSVTNNSGLTHTLHLWVSSQDFTVPNGPNLNVESGMGGTVDTGSLTPTFQAWADKNNDAFIAGATCGLPCSD